MIKRKLEKILRIFLRTCKTVLRKPCINREDKSECSQFNYTVIVLTRTMKFLSVVTPPSVYQFHC